VQWYRSRHQVLRLARTRMWPGHARWSLVCVGKFIPVFTSSTRPRGSQRATRARRGQANGHIMHGRAKPAVVGLDGCLPDCLSIISGCVCPGLLRCSVISRKEVKHVSVLRTGGIISASSLLPQSLTPCLLLAASLTRARRCMSSSPGPAVALLPRPHRPGSTALLTTRCKMSAYC
jgi:hypothetical protein